MVCFGAVIVRPGLKDTFYGSTRPISDKWDPEALAISGFSREDHEKFDDPLKTMQAFRSWLNDNVKGRPILIADNNGFDWQFINWYFHHFLGTNPFGFSSRNQNDMWRGMRSFRNNMKKSFKYLRRTKHDHNPVNDALGNAEALLSMKKMGLDIELI